MESEIGKVVDAGAGHARVEVTRSSMCAHCGAATSCIPTFRGNRIIEVADPLGVSANQRVRIELSGGGLVGASFLAYIVPLVTFFAGTVAGFYLLGETSGEAGGAIGAILGLAAGLVFSRWLARYFGNRGKLTPIITAIVPTDE